MRFITRFLAFGAALCLCLVWLCLVLLFLGSDSRLMCTLMRMYAPPYRTGLPDEEYPGMCRMVTGYLSGSGEFQYVFTQGGTSYLCFEEHEARHMEDVRGLFGLARRVLLMGSLGLAVLTAALFFLPRQGVRSGARAGLLSVLMVLTALEIWGACDFGSFFTAFHRLMFSNMLWLLDPRKDLLIRLMPTDFFIAYAVIAVLLFELPVAAALVATRRKNKEH